MKETLWTETSKYEEEEKETSISLVAASEREKGQTGYSNITGVADCVIDSDSLVEMHGKAYHRRWESCKRKGRRQGSIQSRCGHEEPALKPGGPPPKPKYYLMTDSE